MLKLILDQKLQFRFFVFSTTTFFQGLLIIKAGVSKFLDFSIYREHDIAFTIPTLFVEFSYF